MREGRTDGRTDGRTYGCGKGSRKVGTERRIDQLR